MSKITEEDRFQLHYYHTEKGDITRWVGWKDRLLDIHAEYPELTAAVDLLNIARRTLDAIVEKIYHDTT